MTNTPTTAPANLEVLWEVLDNPLLSDVDALAYLADVDEALAAARHRVADLRACRVASLAEATSARKAAKQLGMSVAAVAKASARARELATS